MPANQIASSLKMESSSGSTGVMQLDTLTTVKRIHSLVLYEASLPTLSALLTNAMHSLQTQAPVYLLNFWQSPLALERHSQPFRICLAFLFYLGCYW